MERKERQMHADASRLEGRELHACKMKTDNQAQGKETMKSKEQKPEPETRQQAEEARKARAERAKKAAAMFAEIRARIMGTP